MSDEPARSLAFMRDPMKWPLMYLPVKRSSPNGGFPQLGLMLGGGPRVYTISMFELPNYTKTPLENIPHTDYIDFEGVVDDGWRVD